MRKGDKVKVRQVQRVASMLWDKKGTVNNVRQDWISVDIEGNLYSFKENELRKIQYTAC